MTNLMQLQVLTFHQYMGFTWNIKPTLISPELADKRIRHTKEEIKELSEAVYSTELTDDQKLVAIADALADILYFTFGTATAYGIDMIPVFNEIHRSNMTKSPSDILDGKAVKGPDYQAPNLEAIIEAQRSAP